MKKVPFFKLLIVPAVLGLIFTFSFCKKDIETITVTNEKTVTVTKTDTVTINDTLRIYITDSAAGKSIKGNASYQDFSGTVKPAPGSLMILYYGSIPNPNTIVYTTTADINGNYEFKFLSKNTYFLAGSFNTDNKNYRLIDGINFKTSPGYVITLPGGVDYNQNIDLVSEPVSGTAKVALDTTAAGFNNFRKVTFEAHSKVAFSFLDYGSKTTIGGGFNTFTLQKFAFDEASPENIMISGYVLLSTVNTFEPARDNLATGCVRKTLCVDTLNATTPLPETDTARFVGTSAVRYGDGYLVHGTLTAFYKHPTGGTYAPDTTAGFTGPFNQCISKPVDLFFTYEKQKIASGSSFNWWFIFEGEFSFRPQTDFYIVSGHFADGPIKVSCHVQLQGTKGVEY